eukprot:6280147-Pyramimonas_sp.AAC.1
MQNREGEKQCEFGTSVWQSLMIDKSQEGWEEGARAVLKIQTLTTYEIEPTVLITCSAACVHTTGQPSLRYVAAHTAPSNIRSPPVCVTLVQLKSLSDASAGRPPSAATPASVTAAQSYRCSVESARRAPSDRT